MCKPLANNIKIEKIFLSLFRHIYLKISRNVVERFRGIAEDLFLKIKETTVKIIATKIMGTMIINI